MSGGDQLRKLPKVDRTLEHPSLVELGLRRSVVRRLVVGEIEGERARILAAMRDGGEPIPKVASLELIASRVREQLDQWLVPHPVPVLNATGVLLHTNLGRAPLSEAARAAALAAAGTCDLELDLATGKRGSRLAQLGPLLAHLFDAEDVLVVNNGAAALLLACSALASPGGVALSRGQHVEIGDGFRVAEMAAAGGSPVHAIGSTNRTHLRDYEAALDHASALLWVHRSNFEQRGFVGEVELAALGQLARAREVPLIADLGSGLIASDGETELPALAGEPSIRSYLEHGATIVSFSGDKLLGGPQTGFLAGSAAAIQRCRRHPLARALRCGKLALAALHATAIAHLQVGVPAVPLYAMLEVEAGTLRHRAERLCASMGWPSSCVRPSVATIGGGSMPGHELESVAIVVPVDSAREAASRLREARPAMVGRICADELWLDLRGLVDATDDTVLSALRCV